jgi:endoglucanase
LSAPTRLLLSTAAFSVCLGFGACSLLSPSDHGATTSTSSAAEKNPIRVDSVGYVPDRAKVATIVLTGTGMLAENTAQVRSAADDSLAWECDVTGPTTDPDTMSVVYVADFSPFATPGSYYIATPGLLDASGNPARSATFQIAADVFRDTLTRAMIGFYGQRCGTAVHIALDKQTWSHAICHQQDASQKYLPPVMMDTIKPSLKGWHDAGDYGKYVTNGAFTVGMLLDAWQHFQPTLAALSLPIPEHGGAIPDFLAEVKWELDWLLTTQRDDGAVSHKVTALQFEGFVMPEADGQPRYYTDIGTVATADFVAVMAQAARIYKPYDADFASICQTAAMLGYQFLQDHLSKITPDTDAFSTGGYGDSSDAGERLWAATELWETTGDPAVLTDVESRLWVSTTSPPALRTQVANNFDWADATNLGMFTYLLSKQPGRTQTIVDALSASAVKVANDLVAVANHSAWGRSIGGYFWGSNGTVARAAMNLWVANALSPDPKYLDAIAMQLDHLLGRNIYDRSQVTGVGIDPPLRPHHRPSVAQHGGSPWPGLLVGGANQQDATATVPAAMTWQDNSAYPELNEVAINWNGALVYAAAALTPAAAP